MRLSIVTDCLSRNAGGLLNGVRRLAQEIHNRKCLVSVFGVADEATADELPRWQPVPVTALPLRGPRAFGYAPGLVSAVRASQPDVIHLHGLWKYASLATMRAAASLGCPYLVNPHGMLDPWAVRNSKWKKRLADWLYQRRVLDGAACIRALNRAEAEAIRSYGLDNPICVIPNGVDLPSAAAPATGAASPFPPGRKILLYLGRIHPKKNLLSLLEAWATVSGRHGAGPQPAGWLLAIAGWDQGGYEARLRRRTTELGLNGSVTFLGPRFNGETSACYEHCDALVLPSLSEGLPMVVLEAWAHAKPVLMTTECNLPDGFSSAAAIRIETSVKGIAAGLPSLFEMAPADRLAMGQRGLSLVKEHYTWPKVAQQMRAVQEWVLSRASAPNCVELS
jgi:glycosyltransferase involved in cell wall biosynthesis